VGHIIELNIYFPRPYNNNWFDDIMSALESIASKVVSNTHFEVDLISSGIS